MLIGLSSEFRKMADVEIIAQMDGPEGFVIVMVKASAPGGQTIPRHAHPGVESTCIIDGEETVSVEGSPDKLCKVGDWFQVPSNVPHSVRTGPDGATVIGTYVIPRGAELTSDL